MSRARTLLMLMLVYGAASLLHFVHNAVYIQSYPNLPQWITPLGVYASWCGIALLGALGYWLYRRVSQPAAMGEHSIAMNATILVEVATASVLLIFVALAGLSVRRPLEAP